MDLSELVKKFSNDAELGQAVRQLISGGAKESSITTDQLRQSGWEITGDPVYPAKKCLTDKTAEGYDPEEGEIELIVHGLNNCAMFALSLPDGSMVNINPASIHELNLFERLILSYEPNY